MLHCDWVNNKDTYFPQDTMDPHVNNGGTYAVQSVNNEGTYPIRGAPLHCCTPIWESCALNRCIHHGSALGTRPAPNHAGTLHCYPTTSYPVSQARGMMYRCLNSSGMAQCWASQDSRGEGWGEGVWNMQTYNLLLVDSIVWASPCIPLKFS